MIRIFLGGLFLLAGCAPDITETDFYTRVPNPAEEAIQVTVGSATIDGVDFTVVADAAPGTGHNVFRISAERNGQPVTGSVGITSFFVVEGNPIATPFSEAQTQLNDAGTAEADLYLIPPPLAGTWRLDLDVDAGGARGLTSIALAVRESLWVQEAGGLIVTWLKPTTPRTGQDAFEVALHRFDAGIFTPIPDATLDLFPYMDMGGGEGHSTPYQRPVHQEGPRYAGQINFIMSGGWDLTVFVDQAGQPRREVQFSGFTVSE